MINIKNLCYQKEWCTCDKQKKCLEKKKNKKLSTQKFWMFSHFWKIINLYEILNIKTLQVTKLISKKQIDNPNYYAPFMMFQKYGIVILKRVCWTP